MAERFDLVVRDGTVVTPSGPTAVDIGIRNGKVAALGDLGGAATAATLDATGLHVLPGVIDTQVHFREPGMEHKEDIAHGSKAAVMGGVTAFFEMPNTSPLTLGKADLEDKLARSAGRAWCDHAYFVGGSEDNVADLAELEHLPGCAGVKVFMGSSTGSLLADKDELLARILANGRRRVAVHAEDEDRLKERQHIAKEAGHPRAHPVWRDEEAALRATKRIVNLATAAGRPVHVLHITSAEELAYLGQHKDVATVETTLNHLTMAAPECYERLGSKAQMNPPVREERHRDALWRAIADGTIDVIGSDHAPHTLEEKQRPYPSSPSGMPGVQTVLPLLLDHMSKGRLSLARLVDLTSDGPHRIYGIAGKGRIAVGWDADLALVDLKAEREITDDWIASKCGWTPFAGTRVTGWPIATVVRGHLAMKDDEVLGLPVGKPVRFWSTL
ncbi:Dihydroorotase and related cyclic amidohydrolase [alpha proteobacterium BAL199]|jgi:dihydroorotase|nr:Dihydroorotase and related cyclic amidohydrolase [alpha proteobacterium BAL199]